MPNRFSVLQVKAGVLKGSRKLDNGLPNLVDLFVWSDYELNFSAAAWEHDAQSEGRFCSVSLELRVDTETS
jgi:hypothetical protein